MNGLLANQGFDTALIALIVALTAFIQQRVSQAKQGAQLDAVQQQQAKQGAASSTPVLVTPMSTVTATTAPVPVGPTQPAPAPAPAVEPQADVLMGHAAHLAAAQAGLQQAQDALALLLATPLPTAPPPDAPPP